MLLDLHVHSHHTAGCALSPRDLARRAREAGLDGLVLTDVNTLEGVAEMRAAGRDEGVVALCGAEIATDHGRYLCYFAAPEKLPALPQVFGATPWSVRDVLRFVADRGGVAAAAHPYDKTIDRPSGDFVFTVDGLAAIEGLCGRSRSAANDLAVEAADHLNLPCIAGSGAHGSIEELGGVATLFREPVATEADLVAQIRAGGVYCATIGAPPVTAAASAGGDRPRTTRGGGRSTTTTPRSRRGGR